MKNRLKEMRQLNNMTLLEVSKALGVVESTVQRYESGAIENLKYDTIVKLSNLYRTTPSHLMGWDDVKDPYDPLKDADWNKAEELYGWAPGITEVIGIYNTLDAPGREQLIQYGKFLLEQSK